MKPPIFVFLFITFAFLALPALPLHAAPGVIKVEAEEEQPKAQPNSNSTDPAPTPAAPDLVLHTKLVEISTLDKEVKLPTDLADLARLKGAELTPAPDLKVHSGALSKISFTREFALPNGENFPLGVVLRVRPISKLPNVSYILDYDVTEFTGYEVQKTNRAAKFTTQHTLGLQGTNALGKDIVVELASRTNNFQGGTYRHKTFVVVSFSKE